VSNFSAICRREPHGTFNETMKMFAKCTIPTNVVGYLPLRSYGTFFVINKTFCYMSRCLKILRFALFTLHKIFTNFIGLISVRYFMLFSTEKIYLRTNDTSVQWTATKPTYLLLSYKKIHFKVLHNVKMKSGFFNFFIAYWRWSSFPSCMSKWVLVV
jgi:hypothetical protein